MMCHGIPKESILRVVRKLSLPNKEKRLVCEDTRNIFAPIPPSRVSSTRIGGMVQPTMHDLACRLNTVGNSHLRKRKPGKISNTGSILTTRKTGNSSISRIAIFPFKSRYSPSNSRFVNSSRLRCHSHVDSVPSYRPMFLRGSFRKRKSPASLETNSQGTEHGFHN